MTVISIDVDALLFSFLALFFSRSVLFLQVDNRPCSRLPSACFPYATEAASFLLAIMSHRPHLFPNLPELIAIRGVKEEIGSRDEETGIKEVKGKLTHPVSSTHTQLSSKQNSINTFPFPACRCVSMNWWLWKYTTVKNVL